MLGEKIRNLRKENKISQEALAEKLGVSRQSISLWENDQTMPSMENIVFIANVFGVSTDTLLKENTEKETEEKIEETIKIKKPLKKKTFMILSIILVLAIIVVSAFVVVNKFSNRKLSAEEIFDLIAPSTVEITAVGDTFESTGTGSFIDNKGTVITNYHVIESCHTINIKTQDGSSYKAESILGFDKDRDLAILKTECQNESFVELKTDKVKTGEKVYTLGSSLGLTGTFSEGIISSASREIEGFVFIQTTAPISHGNSGGPLVDEYGKIVGITTGAFTEGQNLNLAIPASEINAISREKTYSMNDFFQITQGENIKQEEAPNTSEDEIKSDFKAVTLEQLQGTWLLTYTNGNYIKMNISGNTASVEETNWDGSILYWNGSVQLTSKGFKVSGSYQGVNVYGESYITNTTQHCYVSEITQNYFVDTFDDNGPYTWYKQ